MAEDIVIANPETGNDITYNATTSGAVITLTDDAFGLTHAIQDLTSAIKILTTRIT